MHRHVKSIDKYPIGSKLPVLGNTYFFKSAVVLNLPIVLSDKRIYILICSQIITHVFFSTVFTAGKTIFPNGI